MRLRRGRNEIVLWTKRSRWTAARKLGGGILFWRWHFGKRALVDPGSQGEDR